MSWHDEVVVGKTKLGKKLAYRVPEGKSLYEIFFIGGGVVPADLQGSWTDTRQLLNQVAVYMANEGKYMSEAETVQRKDNLKAAKKRPSKLKSKAK